MGLVMSDWEALSPLGEENPNALTTAEVAAKWELSGTQTRMKLRRLEARGVVKKVKTIRRDELDRVYHCWGWLIIDDQEGTP